MPQTIGTSPFGRTVCVCRRLRCRTRRTAPFGAARVLRSNPDARDIRRQTLQIESTGNRDNFGPCRAITSVSRTAGTDNGGSTATSAKTHNDANPREAVTRLHRGFEREHLLFSFESRRRRPNPDAGAARDSWVPGSAANHCVAFRGSMEAALTFPAGHSFAESDVPFRGVSASGRRTEVSGAPADESYAQHCRGCGRGEGL